MKRTNRKAATLGVDPEDHREGPQAGMTAKRLLHQNDEDLLSTQLPTKLILMDRIWI